MAATHTTLKGFSQIGHSLISTQLETNLAQLFSWGLLNKGGFHNIEIPTSGVYGGNKHRLKAVDHPNYTDGQVWDGFRGNWIWESGLEYSPAPIRISGVNVGSTFHAIGATGYTINYPMGRVIFTNAIPTTSTVTVAHSVRWADFWSASKAPWFQHLFNNTDRVDHTQFHQFGSGVYNILRENRVELPAVVVEAVPRTYWQGKQLGGGHIMFQDVEFHVFAQNKWERDQLKDILTMQIDKKFFMFDVNNVDASGAWLNSDGNIASGTKVYEKWVDVPASGGFRYKEFRIDNVSASELMKPYDGLWTATVRTTLEVDMPEV